MTRYLSVLLGAAALSGCDQIAERQLDDIKAKVATDAVAQYNMAKSAGSPIDVCVQAGMVSAAYLQAQDQENYARWKSTESADCARAGLKL